MDRAESEPIFATTSISTSFERRATRRSGEFEIIKFVRNVRAYFRAAKSTANRNSTLMKNLGKVIWRTFEMTGTRVIKFNPGKNDDRQLLMPPNITHVAPSYFRFQLVSWDSCVKPYSLFLISIFLLLIFFYYLIRLQNDYFNLKI